MDIQAAKSDLIKWLASVTDAKIIKQLMTLQKSSLEKGDYKLSKDEKSAIDQEWPQ